jgi:uncharacterized membrane protein YhhN
MSARWINVVMSLSMVATALLGRGAERTNSLVVGFAIFLVAFVAMGSVGIRRLNTALGVWAALSPFVLVYRDPVPGWTAIAAGLVVVVASLWPDRPAPRPERRIATRPA